MITWMQRHKKYLIITIWISTIAFVGAGFVGWGQYSYGDKASSIAKVGEIELTQGELQKSYSNLYAQYNEMFKGNFDEEQAKKFGLQKQALKQLIDQALILNLAKEFSIDISDKEILDRIVSQRYFFKNNIFDKETYKQVLSRNNLSISSYEADIKKQLIIEKLLKLMPVIATENEMNILNTLLDIGDKIKYKVLTKNDIKINTSDTKVKEFWQTQKQKYMTEIKYQISYIKQEKLHLSYTDKKITSYYSENKTHLKGDNGKVLSLTQAKKRVISKLDEKSTKNQALRKYIDFKKNKLDTKVAIFKTTISQSDNILDDKVLQKVATLSITTPFLKPIQIEENYYIVKLEKVIPSKIKNYRDAKAEVLPQYKDKVQKEALISLANKLVKNFKGTTTDYITAQDVDKIKELNADEGTQFLSQLFTQEKKNNFIVLNNGKIILYDIVEQKLLSKDNNNLNDSIVKFKNTLFNEALIKKLQNKYKTEIFIKGL